MTISELKKAIAEKKQLVWDDSDPIDENNYNISFIEDITEDFDRHTLIYIQYNNGDSEAQVFAHEILIQK